MSLDIYLYDILVATLTFAAERGHWTLVAKTLHQEGSAEIDQAIAVASSSVRADVAQPTGRKVQLNEVSYIAKPRTPPI